jgi:hypothetical protein
MAIYNGPARGGTRGGKDQFSWDKVKEVMMMHNLCLDARFSHAFHPQWLYSSVFEG